MLKLTTKHEIYEVWSEWSAESVFVDHNPNREEVSFLWKKLWARTPNRPKVFKLKPFFTTDPKQHRLERGEDQ